MAEEKFQIETIAESMKSCMIKSKLRKSEKMRDFFFRILAVFSPIFNKFFKNRLRVLAYHEIADLAKFEAQIKWLKTKYNIIDIQILKDHLLRNNKLPPKPLLITFDDGDFSVYQDGLPILQRYKIPAALFIITNLINSKNIFGGTVPEYFKSQGLSETETMEELKYLKHFLTQND